MNIQRLQRTGSSSRIANLQILKWCGGGGGRWGLNFWGGGGAEYPGSKRPILWRSACTRGRLPDYQTVNLHSHSRSEMSRTPSACLLHLGKSLRKLAFLAGPRRRKRLINPAVGSRVGGLGISVIGAAVAGEVQMQMLPIPTVTLTGRTRSFPLSKMVVVQMLRLEARPTQSRVLILSPDQPLGRYS